MDGLKIYPLQSSRWAEGMRALSFVLLLLSSPFGELYIFWKLMLKAIQKSSENTNTKTKTMTKTKTKTQKKCLKHPTYAIFLKSWWLTHSKYDDRYLTLVILFTPVTLITLVTLFQPYIQFYRAECITVSGFFGEIFPKFKYVRSIWACSLNVS